MQQEINDGTLKGYTLSVSVASGKQVGCVAALGVLVVQLGMQAVKPAVSAVGSSGARSIYL
jgi:hypothetical protein